MTNSNRGYGDEQDVPPSAAAREHARGKIDAAPPEENEHAGIVADHTVREFLDTLADHYDPERVAELAGKRVEEVPRTAQDTDLYGKMVSREATETLSRAVHQSDESTVSYFTGSPDTRADISGMSAITTLEREMLTSAPIIYIFGEPGSGKTNFALLLAEMWRKHHENGEIGTNIRTFEEADKWLPRFGALQDWIEEQTVDIDGGGITQAENANHRLFVFDEASSHAAGHGEQGYETREKLAPMLYKIRKARAGLIIVGHDGKDVHPAIRTLATCVERNRGEFKRATLWEDVKNREGRGKIIELDGIPQTSFHYDDKEATTWDWSERGVDESEDSTQRLTESEARQLAEEMTETEVRKLVATLATDEQTDLSQREIGRLVGEAFYGEQRSQQWVAKWKREYGD